MFLFNIIFGFERHPLCPLVNLMQNDGFQDNLDGVQLNAHFLAVIGHLDPKQTREC